MKTATVKQDRLAMRRESYLSELTKKETSLNQQVEALNTALEAIRAERAALSGDNSTTKTTRKQRSKVRIFPHGLLSKVVREAITTAGTPLKAEQIIAFALPKVKNEVKDVSDEDITKHLNASIYTSPKLTHTGKHGERLFSVKGTEAAK